MLGRRRGARSVNGQCDRASCTRTQAPCAPLTCAATSSSSARRTRRGLPVGRGRSRRCGIRQLNLHEISAGSAPHATVWQGHVRVGRRACTKSHSNKRLASHLRAPAEPRFRVENSGRGAARKSGCNPAYHRRRAPSPSAYPYAEEPARRDRCVAGMWLGRLLPIDVEALNAGYDGCPRDCPTPGSTRRLLFRPVWLADRSAVAVFSPEEQAPASDNRRQRGLRACRERQAC